MELLNRTPHSAGIFTTVIDRDRLLASVVCRSGFALLGDRLEPADDEQVPPVKAEAWKTPYGELDAEQVFLRGGIDLLVFGQAYAPEGRPCRELTLELRAGESFRRSIRVIGDRRWQKTWRGLKPSEPEPFTVMPLVYQRAFGGSPESDLGPMPEGANPLGRGYYLSKEQALDQPLPNLEDPAALIQEWNDRPAPLGVAPYPRDWSLRLLNGIEIGQDAKGQPMLERIKPELFNNAHPQLIIAEPPRPGDEITVSHLTPEGGIAFRLPDQAFHLHLQLGDKHHLIPLHLEAIGILGEQRRVFLSWRACFRYRLDPMERRAVELRAGPVPEALPADYPLQWDPWSGKVLA